MKNYNILIVDDEDNVSSLLCKILKKEKYNVFSACDGIEAIDILEEQNIDIVITDIRMPRLSGIELLKRIKEIDSSIQVIMITAFGELQTAIEALRIGAKDYITKPFDIEDVKKSVKQIVQRMENSREDLEISKEEKKSIENQMIIESEAMKNIMKMIRQVADSKASVIFYGETGTGKELAAHAVHNYSDRAGRPFIKVNCAAIPEQLLESELFGYEKGAFTGAAMKKPGRFELADGGSIFLDEIGDIPPGVQAKLLRVLQEKEFEHLGGIKTIRVDVRIIAATNRNLKENVQNGKFREDLYYRLNVVPITMPSLRERPEDIPRLIEHFLYRSSVISGRKPKGISRAAIDKMTKYNWPGNIRELENAIERCVVITSNDEIQIEDLPPLIINNDKFDGMSTLNETIDNTERDIIINTLRECSGNRTKASMVLGISRRSLHRKIAKYDIEE